MSELLGRWPVGIDGAVAWGDVDMLGHVNNTVYLRWFESGRIRYFEEAGLLEHPGNAGTPLARGPILARQTIDYRQPLTYPDFVRTEVTVTKIGTTSLTLAFRIKSRKKGDLVVAEGDGVIVLVDYRTGQKIPLDAETKAAIARLESRPTLGPG